jgi:pyruvate dehydrogenase E1 component
MGQIGKPGGSSAYFRLTTRPIDQDLAALPVDDPDRGRRRDHVLGGGYRLITAPRRPQIVLVGVGALMPEVLAAAGQLDGGGVSVDAICLTSPDLIFRACQARRGLGGAADEILDELFPPNRAAPIVTVLDGHPHTLSFLGSIQQVPITCLGVDDFGQSGDIQDLYRHFGIDTETIVSAAVDLLEEATP